MMTSREELSCVVFPIVVGVRQRYPREISTNGFLAANHSAGATHARATRAITCNKSLENMSSITIETAAVGFVGLVGLNLVLKALSHLYKTFLRPAKDLKKLGKWAVVTGATGKKLKCLRTEQE